MPKPVAKTKIDEPFYQAVLRFVSRRISRPEDAEEIVQETFARLIEKGPQPTSDETQEANVVGWVYRTARNATIDFYRRASIRKAVEFDESTFSADWDENTQNEVASCLSPLLQKLNETDREILHKIDIEGLSQKDLAEQRSTPYPTIKSQLQRARKKLRESLVSCCELTLSKSGLPVDCESDDRCC